MAATYTCDKCGMSVNMTCATCDAPLENGTLTTDAGVAALWARAPWC